MVISSLFFVFCGRLAHLLSTLSLISAMVAVKNRRHAIIPLHPKPSVVEKKDYSSQSKKEEIVDNNEKVESKSKGNKKNQNKGNKDSDDPSKAKVSSSSSNSDAILNSKKEETKEFKLIEPEELESNGPNTINYWPIFIIAIEHGLITWKYFIRDSIGTTIVKKLSLLERRYQNNPNRVITQAIANDEEIYFMFITMSSMILSMSLVGVYLQKLLFFLSRTGSSSQESRDGTFDFTKHALTAFIISIAALSAFQHQPIEFTQVSLSNVLSLSIPFPIGPGSLIQLVWQFDHLLKWGKYKADYISGFEHMYFLRALSALLHIIELSRCASSDESNYSFLICQNYVSFYSETFFSAFNVLIIFWLILPRYIQEHKISLIALVVSFAALMVFLGSAAQASQVRDEDAFFKQGSDVLGIVSVAVTLSGIIVGGSASLSVLMIILAYFFSVHNMRS